VKGENGQGDKRWRLIRSRTVAAALLASFMMMAGCSKPPQMPKSSWNIIGSLRTAVSAKNNDWLEQNAKLIEQQRAKHELSDEQYAEFESIVADARQGNWDAATKEVLRLEHGQRP
jgi:hypothetical protein